MATERKLYGYVIHVADKTGDGLFVPYNRDPVQIARALSSLEQYKIVEVYS